ncbi:MAG TPA: hypothetical protein VFD68_08485 [Gemmatimonadales bacterium]|nr:hypothetical protein [Gemmatimonadales bacterium]
MIAIEITAPDSLEELVTLVPHARALDGHLDSVPVTFIWSTLDTAILTVLDSTTGRTVVNHAGNTGRLLARTGSMFSNPVVIRALAAADTVYPTPATRVADTVHLSVDSLSDSLAVLIADIIDSTSGGNSLTVPLAGRPVAYSITFPTVPGPVTLVTSDTAHTLVTGDTVSSGSLGIASVKLRLIAGPVPDSVLVTASAHRAVGTPVPGSPVTFVVRFLP